MKKLKLDLDQLEVQSFETTKQQDQGRGTVYGHGVLTCGCTQGEETCAASCQSCQATCIECAYTVFHTCLTACGETCLAPTCGC